MKYYIYISDAKVDMMFPQISAADREKMKEEVKLKGPFFSYVNQVKIGEDRISRLLAVVSHILKRHPVGSIHAPETYVQDTLTVAGGVFETSGVAYFAGRTEATMVGLGGSAHHVVGMEDTKKVQFGSQVSSLIDFLANFAHTEEQVKNYGQSDLFLRDAAQFGTRPLAEWIQLVSAAPRQILGPQQKVEFLARRLQCGSYESVVGLKKVLLLTPIYVALVE